MERTVARLLQTLDSWPGTERLDLNFDAPVLMVVDWVDAVGQLRSDELHAARRWQAFASQARALIDSDGGSCLLRTYGNGLLLAMDDAVQAAAMARSLHRLARDNHDGHRPGQRLELRIGLHRRAGGSAHLMAELEPDGESAQMAAQLCLLAGPAETLLSDAVRDGLTDGLDGRLLDLGPRPTADAEPQVHAFRLLHDRAVNPQQPGRPVESAATLAIIPFALQMGTPGDRVLGHLLADKLCHRLGGDTAWRVINRLSTAPFIDRPDDASALRQALQATHALQGRVSRTGARLLVSWQLTDLQTRQRLAGDSLSLAQTDALDPAGQTLAPLTEVVASVLALEHRPVPHATLPTVEEQCRLLLAQPALFRTVPGDFEQGRVQLQNLVARHPEDAAPRAWLALWHLLSGLQFVGPGEAGATRSRGIARDLAAAALHRAPGDPFVLVVHAMVQSLTGGDAEAAAQSVGAALALDPNDSLGWLAHAVLGGRRGDPEAGSRALAAARARSPLDPLGWLFDALGADLLLRQHRLQDAIQLARRSIRSNSRQALARRVLTIAQVEADQIDAARASLRDLLSLRPRLTSRCDEAEHRTDPDHPRHGRALRQAGLPAG